jgi:hypothetical protein
VRRLLVRARVSRGRRRDGRNTESERVQAAEGGVGEVKTGGQAGRQDAAAAYCIGQAEGGGQRTAGGGRR